MRVFTRHSSAGWMSVKQSLVTVPVIVRLSSSCCSPLLPLSCLCVALSNKMQLFTLRLGILTRALKHQLSGTVTLLAISCYNICLSGISTFQQYTVSGMIINTGQFCSAHFTSSADVQCNEGSMEVNIAELTV